MSHFLFDQLHSLFQKAFSHQHLKSLAAPKNISIETLTPSYLVWFLEQHQAPLSSHNASHGLSEVIRILEWMDPQYLNESYLEQHLTQQTPLGAKWVSLIKKPLCSFLLWKQTYSHEWLASVQLSTECLEAFLEQHSSENHLAAYDFLAQMGFQTYGGLAVHQFIRRYLGQTITVQEWHQMSQTWEQHTKVPPGILGLYLEAWTQPLMILEDMAFCRNTPCCEQCPLQSNCAYNNTEQTHEHLTPLERLQRKLQKGDHASLNPTELFQVLFEWNAPKNIAAENWQTWSEKSVSELEGLNPHTPRLGEKLKAFTELCQRFHEKRLEPGTLLSSSHAVYEHFRWRLHAAQQEHFIVVLLDSQNQYLNDVVVTKGLLNRSLVHPREVFGAAIAQRAASVILVHNHPSGNPEASQEDLRVTQRLVDAGKLMGIHVLDHIIIGHHQYLSFADEGQLS